MPQITLIKVSPENAMFNGNGLRIKYGVVESLLGDCFIASCDSGICYLGFPLQGIQSLLEELQKTWPQAVFCEDIPAIRKMATAVFSIDNTSSVNLFIKGTAFQIKVWQALLDIPRGTTTNYSDVAQSIAAPKAVRAVGTAIGKNPVSYLIPCHRVVPKCGGVGNYLWGSDGKAKLLANEKSTVIDKKQK